MQGISSLGGVKGTSVYFADASIIGMQNLINKLFIHARIKIRSIHDIILNYNKVTVTENWGFTYGIVAGKDKLDRYTNYDFEIGVTMKSASNKEVM